MARQSLDDILFGNAQQGAPGTVSSQTSRPSLDSILFDNSPAQQPISQPEQSFGDKALDFAGGVLEGIMMPTNAALEVISQFNRPQGAIIEGIKAYQNDTPILEGMARGFGRTDASFKETFPEEFAREDPYYAASILGFGADVVADPLNFIPPAKIAAGAAKASKAIGLTDKVLSPAAKAFKASETGKSIIATAQDLAGVNRAESLQDAFRAGRAADQVHGQDLIDEVQQLKKRYGENATTLTDYIEAIDPANRAAPGAYKLPQEADVFPTQFEYNLQKEADDLAKTFQGRGIDEAQAKLLAGDVINQRRMSDISDAVTGYQKGEYRNPTLDRAWKEHEATGRDFTYADIDFSNLGGLNKWAGTNSAADVHVRNIADIVKQSIDEAGIKNAQLFRHGGDEWSVVVPDLSKEALDNALKNASIKVQQYAAQNGLADIYHPKLQKNTGVGIYYGVESTSKAKSIKDLINGAEIGTSNAKKALEGNQDVNRIISQTMGAGTPQGQTGRIGQGAAENVPGGAQNAGRNGSPQGGLEGQGSIQGSGLGSPAQGDFSIAQNVIKASGDGSLAKMIVRGDVSRPQAFDILRDNGKEIPDYLLTDKQILAKEAGEQIPDYVTRRQVLESIPDETLRKTVQTIGDKIVELNKRNQERLAKAGRLSDEALVRFSDGSHLRRSYEQYENPTQFLTDVKKHGTPEEYRRVYKAVMQSNAPGRQGFGRQHSVDMTDFFQRQHLSEETMKKMGIITDPEYRVMDTLNRSSKTIREDEFLARVNQMFGVDADMAADLSRNLPARRRYVPIPDGDAFGPLKGRWVPRDVANQVMGTLGKNRPEPGSLNESWQKLVSWWKVGKLANPASTMRNFYSGLPMATTFGKVPITALPQQMTKLYKSWGAGGKNSPLVREMREAGLFDSPWERQDLQNIIGDKSSGIKKAADWGMKVFGAPDQFWRAVVYSYYRDQGRSIQEATKIARRALLDYANSPEWVNTLSRSGAVPFIKFPFHATKATAKALYNDPASVTRWTKAQNQTNTEDREKIMPEYQKARQLLPLGEGERIVNGQPQRVQQNLDLGYILPFANDVSVGNPAIDALMLARTGRNGLGQQVIQPGMSDEEKAAAWAKFGANAVAPTLASPYTIEKLINGAQGRVDSQGRQYSLGEAVAQVGLGLKNVPINTEEQYKQKISEIRRQRQDIAAVINQIRRDQRLTLEEKQERIKNHAARIRKLTTEAREAQEAYRRLKAKGAI